MAFSWGGFARNLSDRIDKNQEREAEGAEWERRAKLEKELEKKYGAEVVSSTGTIGNEEVSYNKFGDIIRRRPLTAEELKLRDATINKADADSRLSVFNADSAPRKLDADLRLTEQQIDASRDASARGWAGVGIERERLSLDREANTGLPKAVATEVYETIAMLNDLPPNGITSPALEAEAYERSIEEAQAKGDLAEVRRITARTQGQIASRLRVRKTGDTTRGGGFGSGSIVAPTLPGE
jgi:hypothetical protein